MAKQPSELEKFLFGKKVSNWSDLAHFLTGYKYLMLTGKDPRVWPEVWHERTSWKHYIQPDAEAIYVPKVRKRSIESRSFWWPEMYLGVTIKQTDPGGANLYGTGTGMPIQMGTDSMRNVTYGWAVYGQQSKMKIPTPASGKYWIGGAPRPAYDKNACIVAPSGDVYELIQFDPNAPETPITNQALGIGVFRDKELIAGKPTGAGKVANSAYSWDVTSSKRPHTQRLVVADYYGHDGLLPPEDKLGYDTPKINDLFILDPDSKSMEKMLALGGDCAERAWALTTWGCEILDRSGYSDTKASEFKIGKVPHAPTLSIQAGSWPEGSNIAQFEIAIEDLRYVTYYEET